MGGIKPHGKGIQVTFYWNGERFRPTLKIPPTATNLKYAERLKGEVERAISLGNYTLDDYIKHFPTSRLAKSAPTKSGRETFREISDKWLLASSHLSNGTLVKYRQALAFWLEYIGDEPIDNIQYSTIAALANSQGWNAKNRNNILIPLRQVMEIAYLDGLIDNNPAAKIKNAKVQKEPPDPLTADEVDAVLAYMQKYDAQIVNYFEFSFFTGLRPSEAITLRWGDIDHKRTLARVQRARTFGQEHETKTFKVRHVELNARALAALARQKQHTFLKGGYVFENPVTGAPYSEERPLRRAYWNPTLKAMGIRERHCYQTRHTYATLNLMAGANPMWLAKQMGHANMHMILTVYSKWIEGADKSKECGKIDIMFGKAATNKPLIINNNI
jgi:integrase